MNKGASYSLLAMMVLLIAALGLGVYAKFSSKVLNINADTELTGLPQYETPCRVQPTLLKVGLNSFENGGLSFSLEDPVVVVEGKLITFIEAQKRDIIGSVRNVTKDMDLQEGVLGVATGDSFSLSVLESSPSPELCLKGIK